ncbi:MAG TPA: sigma-70 family RNA polymerase sigma factor [Actinomycetota bacterium]|nr:sigma-70 family RNA polymerase sigma factor [Actinomycetota bacterium]
MSEESSRRFEELILPEVAFVARVARSMSSSSAQAEDLAQETLMKAFRSIDGFDGRHPRAWLARIARNTAINRDQRNREVPVAEPDVGQALGVDDPESLVVDPQMDEVLREALDDLPPEFRAVVQLVDVEQMRYQEAADALGIPVGTVMSRLHRARARLRAAVKGTHLDRERRG